ncbi:MAG TPA: hypothetical protein VGX28_03000 [Frankiaceae bacterium]|jgi:hypothetical protein|nr:hypothetical protein [Frankiaceae bacterium]
MTDPYASPEPVPPSRAPRAMLFVGLFLLGFVGVLGLLFLRAPRPPDFVSPPGYVRISAEQAGGANLSESRTARLLGIPDVPGWEHAVLRAYGRPPGEPPRAVVVLAIESSEAQRALEVAVAAADARGERFPTPEGLVGYHDTQDAQGRYVQRVLFRRGDVVYSVSVLTVRRDEDTSEVVRLAERQRMG